jgi:hypothetical protein
MRRRKLALAFLALAVTVVPGATAADGSLLGNDLFPCPLTDHATDGHSPPIAW